MKIHIPCKQIASKSSFYFWNFSYADVLKEEEAEQNKWRETYDQYAAHLRAKGEEPPPFQKKHTELHLQYLWVISKMQFNWGSSRSEHYEIY